MSITEEFKKKIRRTSEFDYKWNSYPSNTIPLSVADMDFASPDVIRNSMVSWAEKGIFTYEKFHLSLNEKITTWCKNQYNWEINPNYIIYSHGVMSSTDLLIKLFLSKNAPLLVFTPVYPLFLDIKNYNNYDQICIDLLEDKDQESYFLDYKKINTILEKKLKNNFSNGSKENFNGAILFCQPQNPTGHIFSKEELQQLGEIAEKYNLIIFSDEIWSDIIFSKYKHIPLQTIDVCKNRTVTLMAPSKTFNIPGLNFSYMICSNKILYHKIQNYSKYLLGSSSTHGMIATGSAFSYGEPWFKKILITLENNLNDLLIFFDEYPEEFDYITPKSTYLLWVNGKKIEKKYKIQVVKWLINQCKIAPRWVGFSKTNKYSSYFRINYATSQEVLKEVKIRIKNEIEKLKKN